VRAFFSTARSRIQVSPAHMGALPHSCTLSTVLKAWRVCCLLCSWAVQASAEIMRLLAQMAPGCAFEKASIDEAYIDVTQLAVRGYCRVVCELFCMCLMTVLLGRGGEVGQHTRTDLAACCVDCLAMG